MDLNKIHIDLSLVLYKRGSVKELLSPYELKCLESKIEKNHWDEDTVIEYLHRLLKENITDCLGPEDFLDSNVIIETDPYIVKAMELMNMSQVDAQVLLIEKDYKYPGCWVNDIANALHNLKCNASDYYGLVLDAYYVRNYEQNKEIPGWSNLVEVLENYYDSL